jgi:hypothetical protein
MTSAQATADKPATDAQSTALTPPPAPNKAPLATGGKIAALVPGDLEQAYRLANAIAASGMAPKSYKVDPRSDASPFDANKIMVGILHGMEVGFTPMAALQSIAVINGMPSIWGDGALALVEASGLLTEKKEWIEGTGDNMAAHCWMLRRGRKEPIYQIFSMAAAAKAGLKGKTGPWQQYPQRMLQMRARSWAMRDGFSDILRGLAIREEVIDMGDLRQMEDGAYQSAVPPLPTRAAIAATVEAERVIEQDLSRASDRMPDTPEERGDVPEEGESEGGAAKESTQQATAFRWIGETGEFEEFTEPQAWIDHALAQLDARFAAKKKVKPAWDHNAKEWEKVKKALPAGKAGQDAMDRVFLKIDELYEAQKGMK